MQETKFKQTEVEYKTLGEIGVFVRGSGLQKKDFRDSGIPCIHYGQVHTHYSMFVDKTISFVTTETSATLKKAKKNDIIIVCTSENVEDVGKCVVWLGEEEVCVGGETYIFNHTQDAKYIAYYFLTDAFTEFKKKNYTGTKVFRLHENELKNFVIPFPPLAEQERIASALTAADNLIASLDKQIAKTRNLKQGTMQRLLSSFPDDVPRKPLGEFLCYEQPTQYIVKSSDYYDAGIPVLTAGQSFILGYTKEAEGIFDANVDNPVIIFDDFTTSFHWVDFNFKVKSSAMKMLRPSSNNVSFRYVYYAMSCIKYEPVEHSRQWISMYSNFTIPVPPIEEQERIAATLTAMDNQIAALETKRSKYEMVKQGMMQQLLTGTIRLI